MHIYSLRSINSLQAMEMNRKFHPHSLQEWVVREYNSHGLEYFWGPNKVNKWVFSNGGLNRSVPYNWHLLQGS